MLAEINVFGEVIKAKAENKKVLKEEGVKKEPKPVIVEETVAEEEPTNETQPKRVKKSKKQ